jgi:hypothetical protein
MTKLLPYIYQSGYFGSKSNEEKSSGNQARGLRGRALFLGPEFVTSLDF